MSSVVIYRGRCIHKVYFFGGQGLWMRECALEDDISLVTIHHIRRKFVVAVTSKTDWPGLTSVFFCLQGFKCVQKNSVGLCKLGFPWREHGQWTTGNFKSKCKNFVWFILCIKKEFVTLSVWITTFDLIMDCWGQWILISLVEYYSSGVLLFQIIFWYIWQRIKFLFYSIFCV